MEKGIEDLDFNEEDYGIAPEPSNPNGYVPDYESLEQEKPWMGEETQPQPAEGSQQEPTQTQEPVQEDDHNEAAMIDAVKEFEESKVDTETKTVPEERVDI